MPPRRLNPRKLLVASVGVATLNYVGTTVTACSSPEDDANQGRQTARDAGADHSALPPGPGVGNLMPPRPQPDAKIQKPDADVHKPDAHLVRLDATVANLVAPPPRWDATIANLMILPPSDAGRKK
jgi:hypothetical protein